jgi:serine protease Do
VDLDGRAVGLVIARAGRTESHVIPAETVKGLLPVLLAGKSAANPVERAEAARAALKQAEAQPAAAEVVAEAKRQVQAAAADEKWWKDHPIESAPAPRETGGGK